MLILLLDKPLNTFKKCEILTLFLYIFLLFSINSFVLSITSFIESLIAFCPLNKSNIILVLTAELPPDRPALQLPEKKLFHEPLKF